MFKKFFQIMITLLAVVFSHSALAEENFVEPLICFNDDSQYIIKIISTYGGVPRRLLSQEGVVTQKEDDKIVRGPFPVEAKREPFNDPILDAHFYKSTYSAEDFCLEVQYSITSATRTFQGRFVGREFPDEEWIVCTLL